MKIINATNARTNLFSLLATTSKSDEPILIQSKKGDCVLVSKDDWDSMEETLLLLSNPRGRKDILEGLNTPLSECVHIEL